MAAGIDIPESGRVSGIALEFSLNEGSPESPSSSPPKVPRRLRRRLLECKSHSTTTVEEIEAKLKEADLRRQKFQEWLSSKAKPKSRNPSRPSSQEDDLGQRLEAKLYAAEQKRLSILTKERMRLAKLDELRQAAKTGLEMRFEKEREELGTKVESRVQQADLNRLSKLTKERMRLAKLDELRQAAKTGLEMRFEKEREELGTKVESRVQQADLNRMLLLKAYRQRSAAVKERRAQSLFLRMVQESKYKECVRAAIHQKRAAAEKKRLGLLEAEKTRARARVLQVRRVAKSVYSQRETERRRLREKLEDRLERAKRQRAEYLRQRGSLHSSVRVKQGEFLSRKLARCWRQFLRLRRTTFALAKAYDALEINEKTVKSMPFEQLALQIESATTLQTVKAFLDRLESRFMLSRAINPTGTPSSSDDISHLLERLASPKRKGTINNANRKRGAKKMGSSGEATNPEKQLRYPVRVVLCAYMILGHPDAVFSEQGDREMSLTEAAAIFVKDFELLIKIILDGPTQNPTQEPMEALPREQSFRSQLAAFDKAWCSYLYCFVVWKVKDARLLEEDLVRAACQLELSMMQKCKLSPEGDKTGLTDDMKAIQKQVTEDQRLIRERVQHLIGNAGIERMECALSDTRSRFSEAMENGSPSVSPVVHISSANPPGLADSPYLVSVSDERSNQIQASEKKSRVVRSLFEKNTSSEPKEFVSSGSTDIQLGLEDSVTGNELLVNEIVHEHCHSFADSFNVNDKDKSGIKAKIKETMEKAFWDGVVDSMKQDEPDYSHFVELMKEVRDELCEISPESWRQEILEVIDPDILSQVLISGSQDVDYLGKILQFALVNLQKLSAPANDDEMRKTHNKLLEELLEISQSGEKSRTSFIIAMIKGLRFVLEQIQTLKQEISKARIRFMEPLIKGPAGLEYLRKAFINRYGSPSDALTSLPLTVQWLSSMRGIAEQEWNEHKDSLSALTTVNSSSGLSLPTTLRTGGSIPMASKQGQIISASISVTEGDQLPECKGEKVDLLVRIGLLKLTSGTERLSLETLPETLKLNLSRLISVQAQLQNIIVTSISMLVLRQTLLSDGISAADMEAMVAKSFKQLSELLDSFEDVGVTEIMETINGSFEGGDNLFDGEKFGGRKDVMASMLGKSLQAGDAVFTRVSLAVYLAARGVVLEGGGTRGKELAEMALRRVGAGALTERVMKAVEVVVVLATVSGNVHRPWYVHIIENM